MYWLRSHFIFSCSIAGIFFWGLPALFIAPLQLAPIFLACLVGCILSRPIFTGGDQVAVYNASKKFPDLFFFGACVYLVIDVTVGRQAYLDNLFFSSQSIDALIENSASQRGAGRGIFGLLAVIFLFSPFIIFDFGLRLGAVRRATFLTLAFVLVMNEVQASRGYLMMAGLSFLLSSYNIGYLRIFGAAVVGILFFFLSSFYRGDFTSVSYYNPLIDSVAWPYINLSLYLEAECGQASYVDFLLQTIQKVVPAFLFDKEILSFNLMASECIYGSSLEELGSISVFTYLAELTYYRPSILVGATAGFILGIFSNGLDRYLIGNRLYSTQVFFGCFVILIMRSRVLDVFSMLLAFGILLILVSSLNRRWLGALVPAR